MNKDKKLNELPEDTLNGNYTAMPKGPSTPNINTDMDPSEEEGLQFGEMNEGDAIEAGYTDENGEAISTAKQDVEGHPTGAYTDIGAGRSSVVHTHKESEKAAKANLH